MSEDLLVRYYQKKQRKASKIVSNELENKIVSNE